MIELNLNPHTQKGLPPDIPLDDEFFVSSHDSETVLRARIISSAGIPLQLIFSHLPPDVEAWQQFHLKPEDADRLAALLFKFRESHIRWHEA